MSFVLAEIKIFQGNLNELIEKKLLINTINAHSYNLAKKDGYFADALCSSDVLLPDGISIVLAKKILFGENFKKIAGADLFFYEMKRLNQLRGKCFFLGSSEKTLRLIAKKISGEYQNVKIASYSPPFVKEFSEQQNREMIQNVNSFKPDVLFIGMTAPKQEKWAYTHFEQLDAGHVCSIGAVFDFYAGNIKRAPGWMIKIGLEWFYRFITEPKRLWKRYMLGNLKFIWYMIIESKISNYLNK